MTKNNTIFAKIYFFEKMKPTYAILPDFATTQKPFVIREINRNHFSSEFHFHNECQLVYILSGSGTRVIGDSVETYEKGDLTFIGPNVPHVWHNNTENELAISIALYINPELVTENLNLFIDTQSLINFFENSVRGLSIIGYKKEKIALILQNMLYEKEMILLSSFVQICNFFTNFEDFIWLNEPILFKNYSSKNQNRVSKLMLFIQQNFRNEITLEDVASVADLQLHSFCRFFKNLTQRTFSDFLNEVRIGFACQLLKQSDMPVAQVAFECGFTNLSYFNRVFKKIKGFTPRDFRVNKLMV